MEQPTKKVLTKEKFLNGIITVRLRKDEISILDAIVGTNCSRSEFLRKKIRRVLKQKS
jgi:hypothetical protein